MNHEAVTLFFLQPIFKEKIWGGTKLKSWYPQESLENHIGECWVISGHKAGETMIKNGKYQGQSLANVYANHPEFFGKKEKGKTFPLLIKILDAAADLSVQVHPNDIYAKDYANDLGKTECWYILDCDVDTTLIYGHNAKTKEELIRLIETGSWANLLHEVPIKKGDFFYVPSGTIHALKKGTLVLEVQQSSDTTYRLFDYERIDDLGEKRELHIKESIDVTTVPFESPNKNIQILKEPDATITHLIDSTFFTVEKIDVQGIYTYKKRTPYILATVIEGRGTINGVLVERGTAFIALITTKELEIVGNISLIFSWE